MSMLGVALAVLVSVAALGLMLWLGWVDYQDESAHRRRMGQAGPRRPAAHAKRGGQGFD